MVEPSRPEVGPPVAHSVVMANQHSPSESLYPQENIPWRKLVSQESKPGEALWWLFLLLAVMAALVLVIVASAGPGMNGGG